jgi:hypothetical protein
MSNRSLMNFVLLRSDGPVFDQRVTPEDLAGSVMTGIVPSEFYSRMTPEPEDSGPRHADCVRGGGTAAAPHAPLQGRTTPTH